MNSNRVIILIIDACGVGEMPDAAKYGDVGAATIPNIAKATNGLIMPNCQKLGLGNIVKIKGIDPISNSSGCYGKMAEQAQGKDSTSGHWEIGGVIIDKPFPKFPCGFPKNIISEFEQLTGLKTIGNIPASGTDIIAELGEKHLLTKELIVYTSADSVFQIAAHEDIYPLSRQYEICEIARELLQGDYAVARVIARPFIGSPGNFKRTSGRKDFSLTPPSDTFLDLMLKNDFKTLSIGKIYDLYCQQGISNSIKTKDNAEVMHHVIDNIKNDTTHHLIFANLVDFDMLFGHRNDTEGFAKELEKFDNNLMELLSSLKENDLLLITADHGCDPTIKSSTDHTREYVPLLCYGPQLQKGINLGIRETFSDIACTVCDLFKIENNFTGKSFLKEIIKA